MLHVTTRVASAHDRRAVLAEYHRLTTALYRVRCELVACGIIPAPLQLATLPRRSATAKRHGLPCVILERTEQ